jgi:hypothetical protein
MPVSPDGQSDITALTAASQGARAGTATGDEVSHLDIVVETARHLPDASAAFARELYEKPVESLIHAGTTVATSAAMGAALGYVLPARGPAALIIGAAFTVPMVVGGYNALNEAHEKVNKGGSLDDASRKLAGQTVHGTYELGLGLVGGIGGTELGSKLARSETLAGTLGQSSQRLIMKGENEALLQFGKIKSVVSDYVGSGQKAEVVTAAKKGFANLDKADVKASPFESTFTDASAMARRVEQYSFAARKVERTLDSGPTAEMQMYFGSLHGHSRYSDGMGLPKDLYASAARQGQHVTTITDHNHAASRTGISPADARAKDQAGTPVNTENPISYAQTFADAAATTVSGKHVSLVGTEMGTTGKAGGPDHKGLTSNGHGHDHGPGAQDHNHGMANPGAVGEKVKAGKDGTVPEFDLKKARLESNEATHLGGVNHINLFEVPTFFEAVREPSTGLRSFLYRAVGKEAPPVVKAPDVIKYNDGDYKAMVTHLDKIKDTTGNTPVIQLNHPRYLADENPALPAARRGRDYGQKSFKNQQEWLDRFADKYVRQIELIKGGALNPNKVDKVQVGDLDPTSFAGYIDKRVHASPTFGRDFHFGEPLGHPGGTGFLSRGLDKPSILEAMRERRTIATTSSQNLSGVLTANDKFVMGAIVDHSAAPKGLTLKMEIAGKIDNDAAYSVKLWGDTKVGDGKLAQVVQQKDLSGAELAQLSNTVVFEPVLGKVGQNSAFFIEVQRKDPITTNLDRMWTAPIWLEQLNGRKHSLITRIMTGGGTQQILPYQQ